MAEPFLGQISLYAFSYAPRGWAMCQGQILPIAQNQALFSLLGTTYGGNGTTTFALPNATGRFLLGFNNTYPLGATGGEANHTLTNQEIPSHIHSIAVANTTATSPTPAGNYYGNSTADYLIYAPAGAANSAITLAPNGGGQAHNNMQPTLALNYCIALQGIFPSRN